MTSFAKYDNNDVIFKVKKAANIGFYVSSNRAQRGYCIKCGTYLFMIYHNSNNIWLYVDTFNFDSTSIDRYDIYLNN